MAEKRKPVDVATAPSSGGGLFDGDMFNTGGGMTMVQSSIYHEQLPVVGMTIRQIRSLFGDRLDIAPNARGLADGTEVGDDHVVAQGQTVAFVRRSGEKGLAPVAKTATGVDGWKISAN